MNATAETASACPCDADADASGQPAACVSLVAPSAEYADANAPAWWSSFFVTVLGVGLFAFVAKMLARYVSYFQAALGDHDAAAPGAAG